MTIRRPGPENEYPWERLPTESDLPWQAFVEYRDLGYAKRGLKPVAQKLEKGVQLLAKWSTQYQWTERVHAYDSWLDRKKVEADVAAIQEMRKRHIEMALGLQGAAALALNKIVTAERSKGEDGKPGPLTLKPSEVTAMAELGVKLERLNRGEPETISAQQVTVTPSSAAAQVEDIVYDWSKLSSIEQRTLIKLARKAKKKVGKAE